MLCTTPAALKRRAGSDLGLTTDDRHAMPRPRRRPAAVAAAARRRLEPYLYSAPSLILIVAVMLVPLALGVSYAFRDIQLLNPFSGGFIGLEHFRALSQRRGLLRRAEEHAAGGPGPPSSCSSSSA